MNARALKVEFDADTHTYRVNGEVWPSVTTILDRYNDLSMVPAHILERAKEFGNHVHEAVHLDCLGILDYDALDLPIARCVDQWRKFVSESGAKVLDSERRVVHPTLRYCGTLDLVLLLPKRGREIRVLGDIKTGTVIPKTTGPQTAAYEAAYDGPSIHERYCLHLEQDRYRLIPLPNRGDFNVFVSALNVWRFFDAA